MVNMAHNSHNWRTCLAFTFRQLSFCYNRSFFFFFRFNFKTKLFADNRSRIEINWLINGSHDSALHQLANYLGDG